MLNHSRHRICLDRKFNDQAVGQCASQLFHALGHQLPVINIEWRAANLIGNVSDRPAPYVQAIFDDGKLVHWRMLGGFHTIDNSGVCENTLDYYASARRELSGKVIRHMNIFLENKWLAPGIL